MYRAGESYVGAAAVYDYIERAKAFIINYDTGDTYPKVYLGSGYSKSEYIYDDGAGGTNYIHIQSSLFYDSSYDWDFKGPQVVLHEYGHCVFAKLAYECWPSATEDDKTFDQEHSLGSSAFAQAIAEFFAFSVKGNDYIDSQYTQIQQTHLESYTYDNFQCSGSNHIHGELVIGAITSLLWDIYDTSSTTDSTPGTDDDSLNGYFSYFWAIMDNVEPLGIGDFWDAWQYSYPYLDDELEEIFLKSNIGRYEYYDYGNSWAWSIMGVKMKSFEIRGMNPTIVINQKVLVRFVLADATDDGNGVVFGPGGILVASRKPDGGNTDFGHSFFNGVLFTNNFVLSTQYTTLTQSGSYWSFWPWFQLSNGYGYGWSSLTQYFTCKANIIYEGFEGDFPSSGWSCGDNNANSGLDFWDDGDQRAYVGGWAGWCADDGSHDPRKYDNNMDAYMKYTGNLHYINLRLTFYYWQQIEVGWDYLQVQVWDNYNSQYITVQTFGTSTTGWIYVDIDLSNIAYKLMYYPGTNNMAFRFLFHSDSSVVYEGSYIDEIYVYG